MNFNFENRIKRYIEYPKGAIFHMLSALKADAEVNISMLDLDFDEQTMTIFAQKHLSFVPNRNGRNLVKMSGAFFGQNVTQFINVSGVTVANLQ